MVEPDGAGKGIVVKSTDFASPFSRDSVRMPLGTSLPSHLHS